MRALEGEARMCPTRGDERVSTIDGGSQADEPLIPSRRRRGGVHARATSHHIRQRRERAGLLTGGGVGEKFRHPSARKVAYF